MVLVTDIFSYMTLPTFLLISAQYNAVVFCLRRDQKILKDNTHPGHSLFTLLPFGKRYRSIHCHTTGLLSSLFPQAGRLLNSSSTLHHKK